MRIMPDNPKPMDVLPLASSIIAAHLSNAKVPSDELPGLVRTIYDTLASIAHGDPPRGVPAVPIAESVTSKHLVCLEDGLKLRMLKRHLSQVHGMSPEKYRARWGLSADYPMTATGYSQVRSKLAKESGLGTRGRRAQPVAVGRPVAKRKALKKRKKASGASL
jgi:predicted transcriptional regulator